MLDYLQPGQAISTGDSFCGVFGKGDYLIDGVEVVVENSAPYQFKDINGLQVLVNLPAALSHFIDEDGEIVSSEEYESAIEEEKSFKGRYPDIPTEIRVRENVRRFGFYQKIMSPATTKYKQFVMKVVGRGVDTGSIFIESALQAGAINFDGKGVFKIFANRIAMEVLDAYAEESLTLGTKYNKVPFADRRSQYTDLKTLGYDGELIFNKEQTDTERYAFERQVFAFELDEAQKIEKHIRDFYTNAIDLALAKPQLTSSVDALRIHNLVTDAWVYTRKLDVKKTSFDDRYTAEKILENVIAELKAFLGNT